MSTHTDHERALMSAHGQAVPVHEYTGTPAPEPAPVPPVTVADIVNLYDGDDSYSFTHDTGTGTDVYRVTLHRDEYAENPRKQFDHIARIVLPGGREFVNIDESERADTLNGAFYRDAGSVWNDLLDKYDSNIAYEIMRVWLTTVHGAVVLPLSRNNYDGSVSVDTSVPFTGAHRPIMHRPGYSVFDYLHSSPDGFAYVPRHLLHETPDPVEYIRAEIDEYDAYATGNVWGYTIERGTVPDDIDPESDEFDPDDIDTPETVGSCFGYYGDHDTSGIVDAINDEL